MLLELKAGAEEEVFKVKVWEPQQKDKKESVEKPEYHFDLSDRSQFNQSSAYHPLVADLRFKFYLLSQQDRHFFLFEDADRQTFLFSPCFPEIHKRNLHLDSFLRNAGNESRWKV